MRNRSLINFLVNNQYGTVFLKTVDASNCVKDAEKIFELLDGVIEEIGEDIVVQVVTDNASNYKKAGEMLMKKRKKLYWTPCAAHCIDLMLEKIGELPQHKNALLKAKKVSNFIYNHNWVLSLARKILGKDLLRPATTRFATAFLTIQSLYDSKDALQQMFVSNDWKNCAWAKKDDGKNVKKIIMDERTFWPSVVYTLQTTSPLVEVLRIVDGEQTPAMGFLYGAMDAWKEKIAKNLNNVEASYKEIWDIIDEKWDFQMHRALHAAAYYLNPKFRWSPDVSQHPEIKRGLYDVMERLVKDNGVYMKIEEQLILYREKKGLFGYRGSLATYQTRPPVLWWGEYGDDTPELKAFAMKILGLTCSASACERNWSTFNQVHTKRRNRLTTERMDDLVFIMYNRKLKQKFVKRSNLKEDEDPLLVENVMSDDEWIADPSDDDDDEDAIEVDAANVEESDEVIRTTRGSGATKTRRGGGIIERGGGSSSSKKRKAALHLIDEDDDDEDWVEEDCEDDEDDVRYAI
ncbi:uncharacterized protein LOC110931946 [Helianthus annuus]|uniref:uncharacterized protein LOC110931946 n=1 Tax=Helianthus annuus TaxID=4232 RepID=UPI000B8F4B03|nr:uncharacterized protein LOC110931946 [Helianthus annuus]